MINPLSGLKKSLPARLLLMFILVSLIITALIVGTLAAGLSSQWRQEIKPHLVQYLTYVNDDIGNPPSVEQAQALAQQLPINIYITGNSVNYSSTGIPLNLDQLEFRNANNRDRVKPLRNKNATANISENISFGEHQNRIVLRNTVGNYQVYYEISHSYPNGRQGKILGAALLLLLSILGISYFLMRRMLQPVHDIKTGVDKMGQGELGYRVPVRADNDLGALVVSINSMATDIEAILDAKRQLLLGVSHELRSPLTRARIATEMLDDSKNKIRIKEDIEEMELLINEILETERMNTDHSPLNRSQVDIDALALSVLEDMQVQQRVSINSTSNLTPANLDEARVRLLLRNLVANALLHGGNAALPPEITLARVNQHTLITVSDSGPGITPEHLSKLTEPFYRADPSRTRATGGVGIGLYLCRLIAEAHGGKLVITSEPGKGVKVEVWLADN